MLLVFWRNDTLAAYWKFTGFAVNVTFLMKVALTIRKCDVTFPVLKPYNIVLLGEQRRNMFPNAFPAEVNAAGITVHKNRVILTQFTRYNCLSHVDIFLKQAMYDA
jgi:hypothetical protein